MQKLLLVLAAAGLLSAQSLQGLPPCAVSCVGNSIPANCNLKPECICKASSFISAISCCVSTACSAADQEATLQYARSICTPAGVTNLPKSAGCTAGASGSATGSASGSSSGSATSAISSPSVTGSGGSVALSASSVVSSLASSASAATASISSEASSAASSAAAAATSGAGDKLVAQLGAVGAGVLGVAALL